MSARIIVEAGVEYAPIDKPEMPLDITQKILLLIWDKMPIHIDPGTALTCQMMIVGG